MIVKVAGSGGSGASNLVRYIAEDELAPEIEGEHERELFSRDDDVLSRGDAERYVGGGRMPQAEDLVHLIVSLSPDEFEVLGENEDERRDALRDLARTAVRELSSEARTGDLRFVAAVHRNSAYPHVHMAIAREGERKRLEHLPRSVWRSEGGDGSGIKDRLDHRLEQLAHPTERISVEIPGRGLVARDIIGRDGATRDELTVGRWLAAEAAASSNQAAVAQSKLWGLRRAVKALDAATSAKGELPLAAAVARPDLRFMLDREQLRPVTIPAPHREQLVVERALRLESARRSLGASVRADLELDHARYVYARIADNGERLRYGAGELPTSLRDQTRLAEAVSYRAAELREPRTSEERDEIVQTSYAASLAGGSGIARVIAVKHQKHVDRVRGEAVEAEKAAHALRPAAIEAQAVYGKELQGLIGDDARLELENQAAERGDANAFAFLDLGRDRPRDDVAASRLLAWKELSEATVRTARERLDSFDRDRHTRRVDVDGRHWSLAVLDRDTERQTREGEYLDGRLSIFERHALKREGQSDWVSRTLGSLVKPRGPSLDRQLRLPGILGDALDRVHALSSRPAKLEVSAFERAKGVREELRVIERARPVVIATLDAERRELARDVSEAERFVRVVEASVERMQSGPESRAAKPAFEPYEIRRLERDAARSRDVELFERAVTLADTIAETPRVAHSRSLARELDARVAVEAARERLDRHDRFRDSVPVEVDGSIHRLRQIAPELIRPVWNVRVPDARSAAERVLGTEIRFNVHVSSKALRRTVFKSAEERVLERRVRQGLDEIRDRFAREVDGAGRVLEAAVAHREVTSVRAPADTKAIFSIDELHRLEVYGAGGGNEPLRAFVSEEVRSAIDEKRWERNETYRGAGEKERSRDSSESPDIERTSQGGTAPKLEPVDPPTVSASSDRESDSLPPRSPGEDLTRGQLLALAKVLGPVVDIGVRRPNGKMRELALGVAELDRRIGYLRHENAHGADIFIRPHESTGVVLMDDVSRAKLRDLKRDGVQPAAVVESSPGNFQAWVRVARQSVDLAVASAVARDLAETHGTDKRGVAWNHYGRCPGFTNRKPTRATERGAPFAKLHEASDRVADRGPELVRQAELQLSTPTPLPDRALQSPDRKSVPSDRDADPKASFERLASRLAPDIARDSSRVDFRVAVGLAREGRDRSFIREAIERGSPGFEERRKSEGYVDRTIDKAAAFLTKFRERGPERGR